MRKEQTVRAFLDEVYGYAALRTFLINPRSQHLYTTLEGTILGTTPCTYGDHEMDTLIPFRPPMIKTTAQVSYYGSVLHTHFPYHLIHHSTFVQTSAQAVRKYLTDHIHAFFPDTIITAFGTKNRRWHYTFSNASLWCYLSGLGTGQAKTIFFSFLLTEPDKEELNTLVKNYITRQQRNGKKMTV